MTAHPPGPVNPTPSPRLPFPTRPLWFVHVKKNCETPLSRRRGLGFRIAIVALALLAVEGILRVAAHQGLLPVRVLPTTGRTGPVRFLGDLSPHFGAWHVPGATASIATADGEIRYVSNAQGMRDRSRTLKSAASERVAVMGDSFVEGVGVDVTNRFTDILEARTGVEFLNFGTAGHFGSIQEWLLYKHLASTFDHSRVFLFLLPDNDLADNQTPDASTTRYLPYLQKEGDTYRVVYPFPFDQVEDRQRHLPWGRWFRNQVLNRWYTANALSSFQIRKARRSVFRSSSYDTYSGEDLKKLIYSYEQIRILARPRQLTVFVIPRDADFVAHAAGRHQGRIVADLVAAAARSEGIRIVDLMPGFLSYMRDHGVSHRAFFLDHDPHWSPLGHSVAADIVLATHRDLLPARP